MEWKMPDLGEGVQEGEIIKWLVKEGDKVTHDQHLVEIMTDKATMEIPSPLDGVVQEIVLKEGAMARIGQTLAVIGEEGGEHPSPQPSPTRGEGVTKDVIASSEGAKQSPSDKKGIATSPSVPRNDKTTDKERETKQIPSPLVGEGQGGGGLPLAAPAVRQFARDKNIDLKEVTGSGPGGRILREDIEKFTKGGAPKRPSPQPSPTRGEGEERIPLRGLRRKIAEHMALSRRTAAHFTHVDEVDMTELVLIRESAKAAAAEKGVKLTYLPFFIKAVLRGLQKYPILNSSLDDATHEIILKKYYNIGVAVATEDGLIVPVIKNVDSLSILEIAKEISRLGEAARQRKLTVEDLKGGTFTLTNIGSIGGMFSAPIINYPEVAIMGLHQIKPTPSVREGQIVVRQMMYLSVSADHRVVDGAEVASFVKEVINFLEHPGAAFLELV